MNRFYGRLFVLACLLSFATKANAQLVYEFADSTGTATTNFSINGTGGTVTIRAYLHDTSSGAGILNAKGGLGSAAVRLTFNNPTGIVTLDTSTPTSTDITAGPSWGSSTTNGSVANNSGVLNLISPLGNGVLPDTGGRIFLGSFTLHGVAPGTVNLKLTDPNPTIAGDTTYFSDGTSLDTVVGSSSVITDGNAVLTFTAVPEPAEIISILAVIAGFIVFFRPR